MNKTNKWMYKESANIMVLVFPVIGDTDTQNSYRKNQKKKSQ